MSEVVEVDMEALPRSVPINSKVSPLETATGVRNENRHPPLQEVESWLPVTESRKGNTFTATSHLISSGIGTQVLLLPFAFVTLGWYWGILSLLLLYVWQLYTTWLLVNLHESPDGIRYSRFLHISIVAFGQKMGKLLGVFPVMYLSGGTCVLFIITGGAMLEQLYHVVMCYDESHCNASLTGAQWFSIFNCLAIGIALFFPNMNSLALVSLAGSIAAVLYCTFIWTLSINDFSHNLAYHDKFGEKPTSGINKFCEVLTAIGIISLTFRGHNVMLEIQGTILSSGKHRSKKQMWKGVIISYLTIALSVFPVAIGGYWVYGDKLPSSGGILSALRAQFHESKWLLATIYFLVLIHYLSAFQIYAMIIFDNLERIYVTRNSKPCSRLIRSGIKLFFGGLAYFIATAFPFLPSLGAFIGGIVLPLTFAYPCFIWIAIKRKDNESRSSRIVSILWYLNMVIGSLGVLMSVSLVVVALWSLIVNKLDANFFNPLPSRH